jgi:hypothetical protein
MQFTTGSYMLWAAIMIVITAVLVLAVRRYYDALDQRA